MKLQSSSVLFVCCALASTGLVLGCYATAGAGTAAPPPEPVVVQTEDNVVYEAPPPQIETYPVVVYDNRPHYYYEGRWYHRSGRGWGYYKREPEHLTKHRPPARHEEHREGRHEGR